MSMPIADAWWSSFRTAGEVEVTYVELKPDPEREAAALELLNGAERSQWQRYQHPGPRRRFSLCRAALRAKLGLRLGCAGERIEFRFSTYGKPFANVGGSPAPISFNISHSGDHGLIAIARSGRVGVDVEERSARHDLDGPMAAVLGPDERWALSQVRRDRRHHLFFRIWTIKEALIKGLGTGHHTDVSGFQVPASMRGGESEGLFRFPHLPAVTWRLEDLGNSDFAAAVAHELPPGSHYSLTRD